MKNKAQQKYGSWLLVNPNANEYDKQNAYNQIVKEIYSSLSVQEKKLIDSYIQKMHTI